MRIQMGTAMARQTHRPCLCSAAPHPVAACSAPPLQLQRPWPCRRCWHSSAVQPQPLLLAVRHLHLLQDRPHRRRLLPRSALCLSRGLAVLLVALCRRQDHRRDALQGCSGISLPQGARRVPLPPMAAAPAAASYLAASCCRRVAPEQPGQALHCMLTQTRLLTQRPLKALQLLPRTAAACSTRPVQLCACMRLQQLLWMQMRTPPPL